MNNMALAGLKSVARFSIGGRGLKPQVYLDDVPITDVARFSIGGRGLKQDLQQPVLGERGVARFSIGGRGLKHCEILATTVPDVSPAFLSAGVD